MTRSASIATEAHDPIQPEIMVLAAAAYASIGPATVQRDRVDYISAIAESWKEQTLLNVAGHSCTRGDRNVIAAEVGDIAQVVHASAASDPRYTNIHHR